MAPRAQWKWITMLRPLPVGTEIGEPGRAGAKPRGDELGELVGRDAGADGRRLPPPPRNMPAPLSATLSARPPPGTNEAAPRAMGITAFFATFFKPRAILPKREPTTAAAASACSWP